MVLETLVAEAAAHGASDIHLRAGSPPLVRVNGILERWDDVPSVSAEDLEQVAKKLLSPVQQERLRTHFEVDLAWQAPDVARCRASVFRQRGTVGIALRLIPGLIPDLETLGL